MLPCPFDIPGRGLDSWEMALFFGQRPSRPQGFRDDVYSEPNLTVWV